MTYGTWPGSLFKVSLPVDKDKPENERPYFELIHLSAREMKKQLDEIQAKLLKDPDSVSEKGIVFEVLKKAVAGWGNIKNAQGEPVPFDINELDNLLTIAQMWQLRSLWLEQGFGLEERKN